MAFSLIPLSIVLCPFFLFWINWSIWCLLSNSNPTELELVEVGVDFFFQCHKKKKNPHLILHGGKDLHDLFYGVETCSGPKFFGTQICFIQNFWRPNFFGTQIFWDPKFLGPKFFRDLEIFGTRFFYQVPNFFWTQIFLDPNFFWTKFFPDPNFLGPKIFMGPKFFLGPKFISGSNFLLIYILFYPNFFWT